MKVFVLGKLGGVTHWEEDAIAGFRAAGHEVRFGITRNPYLGRTLEQWLMAPTFGAPLVRRIIRAIVRFSPDLILAVGAYRMPRAILERIARSAGRPPLVGWVGDAFAATENLAAACLDAVAYTDTGLLVRHHDWHFPCPAIYLPHAANPRLGDGSASHRRRDARRMVFVANPTEHRRAVVDRVDQVMTLYGPGWTQGARTRHEIHARRIGVRELGAIYSANLAVLNIRNEHNMLAGLNQRHFDPYLFGTPVVSDDQPDLVRCFEPGHEILVYHNADELNEIYARLRTEPGYAAEIGARGQRRALSEHTYARRLETLANLI